MGGGSGTEFWADKFVPTKATKQALITNLILAVGSLNEMQVAEGLDSFFFGRRVVRPRRRDSACR
jgi:hypothetical protein